MPLPPHPVDPAGKIAVLEARADFSDKTNERLEAEIKQLREFRHAAINIVNGWADFEKGVDALIGTVRELQTEVRSLKAANEKLTGPGGAIEQLAQLAEDRRFKRRMVGWAASVAGIVTAIWAVAQALFPHIRFPWQQP